MNGPGVRLAEISPAKRALLMQMLRARREAVAAPTTEIMTVSDMLAEAVLPADIDPQRIRPAAKRASTVLLTGATGFIGAYLLAALAEAGVERVVCLVRAASPAEAETRVDEALAAYDLPARDPRTAVVVGDLASPRLGLDDRTFEQLASEVDAIVHCGALVKWTYPYAALRAANVDGTLELLRLATTDRLKPFHLISTVGVFSSAGRDGGAVLETEPLENSGGLAVGYAQSKWVAEKLTHLAAARGVPVGVYRPNTRPDSRTGAFNIADYLSQMLRGCIGLGQAPALDFSISGAPIDYVARAIVHVALERPADGGVFHLVDPVGVDWRRVIAWTARAGYPLEAVDFGDWKRRVDTVPGGFALGPFFSEGKFDQVVLPRFDTTRLQQALAGTRIACPPQDYEQFHLSLQHFARRGFLPPPRLTLDEQDVGWVTAGTKSSEPRGVTS
jgi:thioester reductase-like protein